MQKPRNRSYNLRSKLRNLKDPIQTETWLSIEQFSAEEEKTFKTLKKYKRREAGAQVKRYLVDAERSVAQLIAINSENEENDESKESEKCEVNEELESPSPKDNVEDNKPTCPRLEKREKMQGSEYETLASMKTSAKIAWPSGPNIKRGGKTVRRAFITTKE